MPGDPGHVRGSVHRWERRGGTIAFADMRAEGIREESASLEKRVLFFPAPGNSGFSVVWVGVLASRACGNNVRGYPRQRTS